MITDRLHDWLFRRTLPYWRDHGIDRAAGGFHEALDLARHPASDDGKRVMVQARQIYVFSQAALLGALDDALAAAEQGFRFLTRHYAHDDGGWRHRVTREGLPLDDRRDLYDQAFVVFAMAWYHRASGDAEAIGVARRTLDFIDTLAHPAGGYAEGLDAAGGPLPGPRRQNPHMHLLEACLALHEATKETVYLDRAGLLLDLFRDRFLVAGSLREFFTDDLRPASGPAGRIVEPGHHFEWIWLLHRYGLATGDQRFLGDADTLYRFALAYGVDPVTGAVLDQIAAEGWILEDDRRIWPQTEALRAHASRMEAHGDQAALGRLETLAATLLADHLDAEPGAWREHIAADGHSIKPFLPASSLYHLTAAFVELDRIMCNRRGKS